MIFVAFVSGAQRILCQINPKISPACNSKQAEPISCHENCSWSPAPRTWNSLVVDPINHSHIPWFGKLTENLE